MDRQEGYYWVKHYNKFEIARWNILLGEVFWTLTYSDSLHQDSDFEHINEIRIKEPGELPEF